MQEIEIRATATANPQRVWDVLVDVEAWPAWAPFDEVSVESGSRVGEIRRVRSGHTTTREHVVTFEPPSRYGYVIVSGLPVKDYLAEVVLLPRADEGTDVRWHATFTAKVMGTGWILRRLIERAIRKGADALVLRADTIG